MDKNKDKNVDNDNCKYYHLPPLKTPSEIVAKGERQVGNSNNNDNDSDFNLSGILQV